jgi:hypothetical protein
MNDPFKLRCEIISEIVASLEAERRQKSQLKVVIRVFRWESKLGLKGKH